MTACLIKLLYAIPWKEFYMYNELGELGNKLGKFSSKYWLQLALFDEVLEVS